MARPNADFSSHGAAAGRVRVVVWLLHIALPGLALWLLIAQPGLDVRWEHRPSHFWLVLSVAAVNVVLALQISRAARRRSDARLVLISYAFTLAAGFLLLHALATPGVIVATANGGFEIATPVGLALASLFFVLASIEPRPKLARRVVLWQPVTGRILVALMIAWGVASIGGWSPLAEPLAERAEGPLTWAAAVAIALFLVSALMFFRAHRRKPSVMMVALITAAALLAEALATIVWARAWQLSWWLWHVLMAAAFGFVAYSAYTQYQREGGSAGIFDGIVARDTARAIRSEYGGALEILTNTLQRSVQSGVTDDELDLIVAGLRARFALTEGQTEVLARAARALATEREQTKRLDALSRVGIEARVEHTEDEFLHDVVEVVGDAFAPDVIRIGYVEAGGTVYPDTLVSSSWPDAGDRYAREVTIGNTVGAVVEFARPSGQFRPGDTSIMDTLVAELSIGLDNVRLYRQLDSLFRRYLSPDVADSLRADPSQSDLGGSLVELTALFADLRGFTSFTERTNPEQVTALLNRYFGRTVPIIFRHGGTVVQFVGDAVLAVFDAPRPGPDHAFRAARAALEVQEAIAAEARDHQDWPRFRMGINTGLVLIGNVGSAEFRSFSVVGDAVNVAARLETSAEPGTVLIGESTYRAIEDRAEVASVGALELKGKEHPMAAYRLIGLLDG